MISMRSRKHPKLRTTLFSNEKLKIMKFPTYKNETQKHAEGYKFVAGCDEVGIAPLAGPVVAATVILDPSSIGERRSKNKWWYRVRDSKTCNEKEREELSKFITEHAVDFDNSSRSFS